MSEVTLAEAKSYLGITHTTDDTQIQSIIDGAEQDVEDFCSIKLASEVRTESLDGGGFGLNPTERPVTAVASVTDGITGDVIAASEFNVTDDSIYRIDGARWSEGPPGRWTVVYTGGNVTLPAKIKTVIFDLVYRMYHNKGGKSRQGAAGYGADWAGNDSDLARRLRRFRHGGAVIG